MKLRCETPTAEMKEAVLEAFDATADGSAHNSRTDTFFEHGQWWIQCGTCGAAWSVHDVETEVGEEGFDFERVSEGDGYCEGGAD